MDRRTFLTTLGAAGLAACAQPERDLLSGTDVEGIELGPGTTIATSSSTAPPSTTAAPYPVVVPEEHLPGVSFVARALGATTAVYADTADREPTWSFANPIASGGPLVFLIDDLVDAGRHRVLLPVRPNGSFGWVDVDAVDLEFHNFAILVELSEFRFTLFDHDEPAFSTVVGVARDNAPTPDGTYYTTELLEPLVAGSPYGAYAYGLSGYSETFEQFAGGPGQLGIHGTNDPGTLGTAVSSGCVRMHDDDIIRLVEDIGLPVGVPVAVQA